MKKFLTLFISLILACTAFAQNTDEQLNIYNEAEAAYTIGRLETAESLLKQNLSTFKGNLRQSVFRLLALTSLGLDDEQSAENYVQQLLNDNPYYSTVMDDPQRFIDLVERIKGGMTATITTASSQAENIYESPVPVTLITEEMIRDSGARNLKEVLLAYVPGMTDVDCNDDITLSMRSIYSSGQEKMLFMLDGHRLNSYTTNTASPDFSISLEKVKQIEVLRGPASSLYGGVALTAVVNIITKQGADVDGLVLRAGGGSYGQIKGDLLFGKRYFDLDVLLWGSLFKADGQEYYVPASETGSKLYDGTVTVGGVGKSPSYDAGLSLHYKGLSLLYESNFSQIRSPYTMGQIFSPYDYDSYISFRGLHPGFATKSHHATLGYEHTFDKLSLKAALSYDDGDITHYNVISDEPVNDLSYIIPVPEELNDEMAEYPGLYRYLNTMERSYSGMFKGDYNYINSGNHKGLLSFGMEYNQYRLIGSRYLVGYIYEMRLAEYNYYSSMADGKEKTFDAYAQVKHTWGPFIFNAGLRYDFKTYDDDRQIHQFSPRLSLIYLQPKWNVKLSYSKSFVDAPLLHRKTNAMTMDGQDYLDPEQLRSVQLTFQAVNPLPGLTVELNGFYNRTYSLIYPTGIIYLNTTKGKSFGSELSATYRTKRFNAHLAASWIKVIDSNFFGNKVDYMYSVPAISSSAVLSWQATKNLRLHTHLSFMGSQKNIQLDIETLDFLYSKTKARFLADVGANYTLGRLELRANISNLFNKHYKQGGMGTGLIQQPGRWFLADVAYKF